MALHEKIPFFITFKETVETEGRPHCHTVEWEPTGHKQHGLNSVTVTETAGDSVSQKQSGDVLLYSPACAHKSSLFPMCVHLHTSRSSCTQVRGQPQQPAPHITSDPHPSYLLPRIRFSLTLETTMMRPTKEANGTAVICYTHYVLPLYILQKHSIQLRRSRRHTDKVFFKKKKKLIPNTLQNIPGTGTQVHFKARLYCKHVPWHDQFFNV